MTPAFLVIGAMKAATTSVHEYLRQHPEVFMPPQKELDFFAIDSQWSRGLDWYRSQFAPAGPHAVTGEASPSYSKHPEYPAAAARIHATLPDVKLVYCLRDPIERLVSHYRHEVARGRESRSLDDAVDSDPRYLDTSRYGHQLAQHLEHCAGSRILLVHSEDLRADRSVAMARIFEFLEVDPAWDGHESVGELYATDDRLSTGAGFRWLAESRAVKPLRHRLSPSTKHRARALAHRISGPSRAKTPSPSRADEDIDAGFREELRRRLAEDQALLTELRGQCAP